MATHPTAHPAPPASTAAEPESFWPIIATETDTLTYGGGANLEGIGAALFAHLVRLAQPVLVAYRGDLYHDALWIAERLNAAHQAGQSRVRFWWSVEDTGTDVHPTEPQPGHRRTHLYRFTVTAEGAPLERVSLVTDHLSYTA